MQERWQKRENDPYRTLPRYNLANPRAVNCAVGEESEYGDGSSNYFDGGWGNSDYHGGHPLAQVKFTEKETIIPYVG